MIKSGVFCIRHIKTHFSTDAKIMRRRSKKAENETNRRITLLEKSVNSIGEKLERSHFYDYMNYVSDGKRILRRAFWTGVLKGMGSAVGFTILGAVVVYFLHLLAKSNLPFLADFISDLIDIIEKNK